MNQLIDLTRQHFGALQVLWRAPRDAPTRGGTRVRWVCRCDCGVVKEVDGQMLRLGRSQSCGAPVHMRGRRLTDLTGMRFDSLQVLRRATPEEERPLVDRRPQWVARCDCGTTLAVVGDRLRKRKGKVITCGGDAHRAHGVAPGRRFGALTVLAPAGPRDSPRWRQLWECRCDCGATKVVPAGPLLLGHTRSCGDPAHRRGTRLLDLVGQRFGALQVLRRAAPEQEAKAGRSSWVCRCDCGATCVVPGIRLRQRRNRSCGAPLHRVGRSPRDLVGRRFGALEVLQPAPPRPDGPRKQARWECRCDCGATKTVATAALTSGHTKTCGAPAHTLGRRLIDLTGRRVGRLEVLGLDAQRSTRGNARWRCRCDCGNITLVEGALLRGNKTRSCGCLFREQAIRHLPWAKARAAAAGPGQP